ncbi:hypothetical protein IWW50_002387 [Coemansia erecta]|nr:hypothetical protein GGF43_002452 [Coemansia sp. RSA 2618]KAJ2826380.1 hypothetical protein IWW50_002387 [Coemansia erecta]
MEKNVRQFHAADGAKFIEHVPGHCLVFIPNNTSVDYLLRELRKVKQPKPRAKPKVKSGKPTNAFITYRNEKISELQANNPGISQTEISRMAGSCWKTESEEVKQHYRNKYISAKRVYDLNKPKRPRTESEVGSDSEPPSDTASVASLHCNASVSQIDPMDFSGFNLGFDAGQSGFYTGRRRSQTLPSGGFARSGAKRRISQELRKHLASKSSNAYMAASAGAGLFGDNSGLALPPFPPQQQQQQPSFEFTFTQPLDAHAAPQAGSSAASYMNSSMAPLAMPLNPSFPLAEFSISGSAATPQNIAHHSRTLSSISTPMSIDHNAYSSSGEAFETFVPTMNGMSRPTGDASIPSSLPQLDTANLNAFSSEGMSMTTFSTAGYMNIGTPQMAPASAPWPLTQSYTLLPDTTGADLYQNQQI